jgi:hydroxymethylpyrimidine pyrophosphatase-like HAD family hydrolase
MNGSQLGYIVQSGNGEFDYEEIAAFPLEHKEINKPLQIIESFLKEGVLDLLVFYYPRNWKLGEIIWTPAKNKIPEIQNKYLSASAVYSTTLEKLKDELTRQEICMIFLLIDIPQDKLMAYQHTKRSNFFTHEGVDKHSGAEEISRHLNFDLKHSIGAGDSEMDTFLNAVGLAVHVGNPFLSYKGIVPPLKINNSSELGELLFELAALQRNVIH